MKLVAMGFLMSLATAVGCMTGAASVPPMSSDEPAASEPAASESESEVIQPRATCASQGLTACLNGPTCHHEEGRNIGVFDCPSGTVCCRF